MRKLAGVLALGAMIGFGSSAGAITADGNWSDWFTYGGNVNFNTWNENAVTVQNLNIRSLNDEEGPTPGGGGQKYDVEEIFYMYDDLDPNALSGGKLYIGLVTGFPPQGVPTDNLYAGDMFLDFGNTGGADVAVAVSTRASDLPVYGHVFQTDGVNDIEHTTTFAAGDPYRALRTNTDVTGSFSPAVAWGQYGPHYFLEICLNVDAGLEDILTNPQGGLGLHWTMQCGNDYIDVHDDEPFVPVPEPSTFALLGMGTLGVALRRKFTA